MFKNILCICTLLIFSSAAWAMLGLSRIIPEELKKSDIELMMLHARDKMNGKKVGTTLTWENADTNNHGSVTLQKTFKIKGQSCRVVEHKVILEKEKEGFSYVSTICQDKSGEWVPL